MEKQGTVQKVYSREIKGGKTSYSLGIGDSPDAMDWFGFYTNRPNCNEGDVVSFRYTESGNFKNADIKSFKVVSTGSVAQPSASASNSSARPAKGGHVDNRQSSIIVQSATRNATDLLRLMLDQDAVNLPSAKSKTKAQQAKVYDALMGLHAELTAALYKRAANPQEFLDEMSAADEEVEGAVDASEYDD
jgi:hypothetical protein